MRAGVRGGWAAPLATHFSNLLNLYSRSDVFVPRIKNNFQLSYGFRFLRSGLVPELPTTKVDDYFGLSILPLSLNSFSELMRGCLKLKIADRDLQCFSRRVMVLDF